MNASTLDAAVARLSEAPKMTQGIATLGSPGILNAGSDSTGWFDLFEHDDPRGAGASKAKGISHAKCKAEAT